MFFSELPTLSKALLHCASCDFRYLTAALNLGVTTNRFEAGATEEGIFDHEGFVFLQAAYIMDPTPLDSGKTLSHGTLCESFLLFFSTVLREEIFGSVIELSSASSKSICEPRDLHLLLSLVPSYERKYLGV